jgi:hypothetical protein
MQDIVSWIASSGAGAGSLTASSQRLLICKTNTIPVEGVWFGNKGSKIFSPSQGHRSLLLEVAKF